MSDEHESERYKSGNANFLIGHFRKFRNVGLPTSRLFQDYFLRLLPAAVDDDVVEPFEVRGMFFLIRHS